MALSSVTLVSCVCWEWQRDDGGFSPYQPDISRAIEASNHAGLGAYDVGSGRTVIFAKMTQRKSNTGFERTVRRTTLTLPSTPSVAAYWMWNNSGKEYVLYDIQSSVDIELAYIGCNASVDLSKCTNQLPYTIDFRGMQQIRHGYNTRRKIQRCPLPSGMSLQSLLGLAPPLTSSTGLTGGVVATATHGMGGGFGAHTHAHAPGSGLGFGALISPAPAVMSSVTPASSTRSGGIVKSGSAGLTSSFNLGARSKTRVMAHLGASIPSSIGSTGGLSLASSSTAASRPLYPPPPSAAVSLSSSAPLPTPTPSFSLATTTPASAVPTAFTSSAASSRPIAVARRRNRTTPASAVPTTSTTSSGPTAVAKKGKKKRQKKTASNSTYPSSSSSSSAGLYVGSACPSTSSSVKSKRRDKQVKAGSNVFDDETAKFARKKKKKPKGEDDGPCPICMNKVSEASGFEEEDHGSSSPYSICKLRKCGHMLHHPCLLMYMKNSANSGFQCPTCKKTYGVKTGDMPNGTMNVRSLPSTRLPGHERYGTIEISYNFRPGVYNGRRYNVSAFPRTCYLPDSPQGQKVLRLLRVAWERRLTFTVGTSVTSGMTDTVVWNEIHHKTSIQNHGGHGYPDPGYLDRVLLELAAQGVTDDDGSDNEQESSSSSSSEDDEVEGGACMAVGGAKGDSKSNAIVLSVSSDEEEDSDL